MERKCKCGNFFDVREHSGICNECGTNIFETKKETMKQDTAVDWLISNIVEDQIIKAKSMADWQEIFKQAKELEKQQIINAFKAGADLGNYYVTDEAENYYNEKYGR